MNPKFETKMKNWVIDFVNEKKEFPRRKDILIEASRHVTDKFKASKGWCDKFLKRNKKLFTNLKDNLN